MCRERERRRRATIAARVTPSSEGSGQGSSAPPSDRARQDAEPSRGRPRWRRDPPTVQSRLRSAACGKSASQRGPTPAGAIAFTTEPVQYRAARNQGVSSSTAPRQRRSPGGCGCSSEPAKAAPAIQIQTAEASERPFDPCADPVTEQLTESRRARPVRRSIPGTGQGDAFPARGRGASSVIVLRQSSGPAGSYRHFSSIFTLNSCRARSQPGIGSPPRQVRACSRTAAMRSTPAS